jgi:hypothetical protein
VLPALVHIVPQPDLHDSRHRDLSAVYSGVRSEPSAQHQAPVLPDELPGPRVGKLGGRRRSGIDQFERLQPPIPRKADELKVTLAVAEGPFDRQQGRAWPGRTRSHRPVDRQVDGWAAAVATPDNRRMIDLTSILGRSVEQRRLRQPQERRSLHWGQTPRIHRVLTVVPAPVAKLFVGAVARRDVARAALRHSGEPESPQLPFSLS